MQHLEIFMTPDRFGHFANVNTLTSDGIARADRIGLVDSGLAHLMVVTDLRDAAGLFIDRMRTGRVLTLLRDPVEQALSDYHYRQSLGPDNPLGLSMDTPLSEFAKSADLPTNAIVKGLTNITDSTLVTLAHLRAAKLILENYVVVGLLDEFDESVAYFHDYFGWDFSDHLCVRNFQAARDNRNDHEHLDAQSVEHQTISDRNWADVELYRFARTLFQKRTKPTVG